MEALTSKPTLEQFTAYQAAWSYFNQQLFANTLHPCLLNFSRLTKAYGFFTPKKWAKEDGTFTHEISLNPDLLLRPMQQIFATLVHEMVHQWQEDHGTPPRKCYHNQEWATKMESVGLMPSSTGGPGGKRIGQKVSHYVIEGGPFHEAFLKMPEEFVLPWRSSGKVAKDKAKTRNKLRYTCPGCAANVWGKPDLRIICDECEAMFVCEDGDAGESDNADVTAEWQEAPFLACASVERGQ